MILNSEPPWGSMGARGQIAEVSMARSPVVEANNHEQNRDHRVFDWGLFGWFAFLSSFGAILLILALAVGH